MGFLYCQWWLIYGSYESTDVAMYNLQNGTSRSGNYLFQAYTLKKGLIKYNKINGITPMKIYVGSTHPKLVASKKI